MKIAVIGGGFAGLAAAFHLSRFCKVDLFEEKSIGAGASGVSAGLLHPYPGEHGRLSWRAKEAMQEALVLLKAAEAEAKVPLASYSGILKVGACIGAKEDVEALSNGSFLIHSGVTVFTQRYLQALLQACQKRGVAVLYEKVDQLSDLASYDAIVIAAGAGVKKFAECSGLRVNILKGQALLCRLESPMQRSVVAKQYKALAPDPSLCYIGSTYERGVFSEEPCLEEAIRLLKPDLAVVSCHAALRVTNPAHYFPIAGQVAPKVWAIAALGSRGLLYHGLLGKEISEQIFSKK